MITRLIKGRTYSSNGCSYYLRILNIPYQNDKIVKIKAIFLSKFTGMPMSDRMNITLNKDSIYWEEVNVN